MDDRKNQNREPENGSGGGPKNRQTILIILICLLVSLMVMGLLNNALGGITSEDLDYSKFLDMVNNDEVQEVVLKSGTLTVTPKDQKSEGITYQVTMMGDEQELVDLLQEKGITYHKDPPDSTGTIIYTLLTVILPVVMLVAVMVWVMRSMNKGGGVMGVGKSRAKAYVQKETGVTFRDVAGQDEAKESLQEEVFEKENEIKLLKQEIKNLEEKEAMEQAARETKKVMDSYIQAGFTKDEAFQMVMELSKTILGGGR